LGRGTEAPYADEDKGDAVRWQTAWGPVGVARLEDDGKTLIIAVLIDRRSLVNGLFYGVEGMHVGRMRRLEIAPHLAIGDRGVPGIIPAAAVLTAEITIVEADASTPCRIPSEDVTCRRVAEAGRSCQRPMRSWR